MLKVLNNPFNGQVITNKTKLKIVGISDPHIGSKYGFLPVATETKDGHLVLQSKEQQYMQRNLYAGLDKIGKSDVLVIGGDVCEGKQMKIGGISLSDSDTDTQVEWAVTTFEQIIDRISPDSVVIVDGTPYHTSYGVGGDLDYQVAAVLGREHNVYYGYPVANVKLGKMWWRISHKYPTARNITPPMESFYKEICADAKIKEYNVADVFAWGHAHQCIEPHRIMSTSAYGMLLPALKLNDPYINSGMYGRMPDIGFMYMKQEGDCLSGVFKRIRYM